MQLQAFYELLLTIGNRAFVEELHMHNDHEDRLEYVNEKLTQTQGPGGPDEGLLKVMQALLVGKSAQLRSL